MSCISSGVCLHSPSKVSGVCLHSPLKGFLTGLKHVMYLFRGVSPLPLPADELQPKADGGSSKYLPPVTKTQGPPKGPPAGVTPLSPGQGSQPATAKPAKPPPLAVLLDRQRQQAKSDAGLAAPPLSAGEICGKSPPPQASKKAPPVAGDAAKLPRLGLCPHRRLRRTLRRLLCSPGSHRHLDMLPT